MRVAPWFREVGQVTTQSSVQFQPHRQRLAHQRLKMSFARSGAGENKGRAARRRADKAAQAKRKFRQPRKPLARRNRGEKASNNGGFRGFAKLMSNADATGGPIIAGGDAPPQLTESPSKGSVGVVSPGITRTIEFAKRFADEADRDAGGGGVLLGALVAIDRGLCVKLFLFSMFYCCC